MTFPVGSQAPFLTKYGINLISLGKVKIVPITVGEQWGIEPNHGEAAPPPLQKLLAATKLNLKGERFAYVLITPVFWINLLNFVQSALVLKVRISIIQHI